jgi:Peptidase family M28
MTALLCAGPAVAEDKNGTQQLSAERAFGYLVKICRIGPRPSGSHGMTEQQRLLSEHFTKLEAQVQFQSFDAVHPLDGSAVRMNNMIVSWNPASRERVLLACHYDTRPFPDRDPKNPRGTFVGANDGASGVALFMELGHHMKNLNPTYGVDFVFFDGEELVFGDQGKYFLGSEYFATEYFKNPPNYKYVCGVLVDMIGDRDLALYWEKNSIKFAPQVAESIWKTAKDLKIDEFIPRKKHEIQDDHLPLNQIAGIPTCDIIDFDYRYWHTAGDVPARCSGQSLAKVGRVLLAWLKTVPPPKSN